MAILEYTPEAEAPTIDQNAPSALPSEFQPAPEDLPPPVQAPFGIGPVANIDEYAPSVIGYEQQHFPERAQRRETLTREENAPMSGWGVAGQLGKEAVTTAIEGGTLGLVPPVVWDQAYALAKAGLGNDHLSYDDWYKIVRGRNEEFERDNPWLSKAAVGVGMAGGLAMGGGLLGAVSKGAGIMGTAVPKAVSAAIESLPAWKQMALTSLFNTAASSTGYNTRKQMGEPGYETEVKTNMAIGAAAPVVTTALLGLTSKLGDVGGALWSKFHPNVDQKAAMEALRANPRQFHELKSPGEELGDVVDTVSAVTDHLNEQLNAKAMDVSMAEKVVDKIKGHFDTEHQRLVERAVQEGKAGGEITTDVINAMKGLSNRIDAQYNKGWAEHVPNSEAWVADPSVGVPFTDYERSFNAAISKLPKKTFDNQEKLAAKSITEQLESFKNGVIEDAAGAVASSGVPIQEVKAVQRALSNNHDFFARPDRLAARLRMPDKDGVTNPANEALADVVDQFTPYLKTVNPQKSREHLSTIFENSFGYISDVNPTQATRQIVPKVDGSFKNWHTELRTAIGQRYPGLNPATDVAYKLDLGIRKPLQRKIQPDLMDLNDSARAFERLAKEQSDQGITAIKNLSKVTGVDLYTTADKIRSLDKQLTEIKGMNIDTLMSHLSERRHLSEKALEAIGKLPPETQQVFEGMKQKAMEVLQRQNDMDLLANQIHAEATRYNKLVRKSGEGFKGATPDQVFNWANKLTSSGVKKTQATMDASEQMVALQQAEKYYKAAMNGEGLGNPVSEAIDKLKLMRQQNQLFGVRVNGSRGVQMGEAIGNIGGMALHSMGVPGAATAAAGSLGRVIAGSEEKWGKNFTVGIIKGMLMAGERAKTDTMRKGLLVGTMARQLNNNFFEYGIDPRSPKASDMMNQIKEDPSLSIRQKLDLMKELWEKGFKVTLPWETPVHGQQ